MSAGRCVNCGHALSQHNGLTNACPVTLGMNISGSTFQAEEDAKPAKPTKPTKPTNPKDAVGISKSPLSTVPLNVIAEVGVAMMEGSLKYGRHNYREVGVRSSVYFDATVRHLFAWWEGEDIDPDSGLPHVTKAIASLTVLRDAMTRGKVTDDRPPKTLGMYAELNAKSAELLKRYGDREVEHITEVKS